MTITQTPLVSRATIPASVIATGGELGYGTPRQPQRGLAPPRSRRPYLARHGLRRNRERRRQRGTACRRWRTPDVDGDLRRCRPVIFSGASAVGWRTDLPGLVRYHVCAPMPDISRTAIERVVAKEPRERSYRWCGVRNGRLRHGLPDSGCSARSGRMIFLASWLLHSIPLAAALGLALMAMQAASGYT